MQNLTFQMLVPYNRTQLQKIIKNNGIPCLRLSRLKHEDLIDIIIKNQDKIASLPDVPLDDMGNARRRGRRPQCSDVHKAIVESSSSGERGAVAARSGVDSVPVVHAEPELPEVGYDTEAFGECHLPLEGADAPLVASNRDDEISEAAKAVSYMSGERYEDEERAELALHSLVGVEDKKEEKEPELVPRLRPKASIPRVSIERQADLRRKKQARAPQELRAPQSGRRGGNLEIDVDEAFDEDGYSAHPRTLYAEEARYGGHRDSHSYEPSHTSGYVTDGYGYASSYEEYGADDRYDDLAGEEQARWVPIATGVLDVRSENFGFLRGRSYRIGPNDVHVSLSIIKKFSLRMGDMICGIVKSTKRGERSYDLERIISVNGQPLEKAVRRPSFDKMVPIFPNEQYKLETKEEDMTARVVDLFAPIGKGQRALIVSPPKAGKTICLKKIAAGIAANFPKAVLIALLVDERPEEVTDMERSIKGEVVASTFDEDPIQHIFISHLVLERARRLVEQGRDVVILFDSLTRLGRACNNATPNSGRTMSGGLDISALRMPKRFFGSARKFERGGSLTIVATALIDTGSRMDEVIFEEFKGTGNNEINLSRKLAERRVFPAIDIKKSSTRHDECLQDSQTLETITLLRRTLDSYSGERDPTEVIIENLKKTINNEEFLGRFKRNKVKTAQAVDGQKL